MLTFNNPAGFFLPGMVVISNMVLALFCVVHS